MNRLTYTGEAGLTGRCRGRLGRFGRVVMQVEVRVETRYMFLPESLLSSSTRWRDATADDLMKATVLQGLPLIGAAA